MGMGSHSSRCFQGNQASCCKAVYHGILPASKTELIVDASLHGLGALLVQHNSQHNTVPVALASRSLTDVEARYSQTEREALAISWAVTHFHVYLYRGSFVVTTDHKPLVTLFNSCHAKPPLRIERWILSYKRMILKFSMNQVRITQQTICRAILDHH